MRVHLLLLNIHVCFHLVKHHANSFCLQVYQLERGTTFMTRMHSSRMRTARLRIVPGGGGGEEEEGAVTFDPGQGVGGGVVTFDPGQGGGREVL